MESRVLGFRVLRLESGGLGFRVLGLVSDSTQEVAAAFCWLFQATEALGGKSCSGVSAESKERRRARCAQSRG